MKMTLNNNLVLTVFCVLIASVGCSQSSDSTNLIVQGVVTYQGEPVSAGTVNFDNPATGQAVSVEIEEAGSYETTLPVGEYRVSITPPLEEKSMGPNSPPALLPVNAEDIPKKYRNVKSSKLKVNIDAANSEHNFDLS